MQSTSVKRITNIISCTGNKFLVEFQFSELAPTFNQSPTAVAFNEQAQNKKIYFKGRPENE